MAKSFTQFLKEHLQETINHHWLMKAVEHEEMANRHEEMAKHPMNAHHKEIAKLHKEIAGKFKDLHNAHKLDHAV